MVWNFWHQFLTLFSMLFQMVPFFLLSMVATHSTITWLVETIPTANQRSLCWWSSKLPSWREKDRYHLQEQWKLVLKWHTILFMATNQENKQCHVWGVWLIDFSIKWYWSLYPVQLKMSHIDYLDQGVHRHPYYWGFWTKKTNWPPQTPVSSVSRFSWVSSKSQILIEGCMGVCRHPYYRGLRQKR